MTLREQRLQCRSLTGPPGDRHGTISVYVNDFLLDPIQQASFQMLSPDRWPSFIFSNVDALISPFFSRPKHSLVAGSPRHRGWLGPSLLSRLTVQDVSTGWTPGLLGSVRTQSTEKPEHSVPLLLPQSPAPTKGDYSYLQDRISWAEINFFHCIAKAYIHPMTHFILFIWPLTHSFNQ